MSEPLRIKIDRAVDPRDDEAHVAAFRAVLATMRKVKREPGMELGAIVFVAQLERTPTRCVFVCGHGTHALVAIAAEGYVRSALQCVDVSAEHPTCALAIDLMAHVGEAALGALKKHQDQGGTD